MLSETPAIPISKNTFTLFLVIAGTIASAFSI